MILDVLNAMENIKVGQLIVQGITMNFKNYQINKKGISASYPAKLDNE